MSKYFLLGDKIKVLGQEYENGMYDVIVDITPDKYVIEDGCTYKKCEIELIERKDINDYTKRY